MPYVPDPRFWDALAESYAKKPLPNPQATARKLDVIRAGLRPEARLLDLGCGTGTILLELAPHVAVADGVDVSPNMIRIAQTKAAGQANVTFRAQPAAGLEDIADVSYDTVLAFNLLHLVDDPPALCRSIFRVLRPGGAFVSATACLGGSWFPPYALILPVMRWIGKAPPVTILTRAELLAALEGAGFVDIQAPEVGSAAEHVFLVAQKPA